VEELAATAVRRDAPGGNPLAERAGRDAHPAGPGRPPTSRLSGS
jgi:hypothetical protein